MTNGSCKRTRLGASPCFALQAERRTPKDCTLERARAEHASRHFRPRSCSSVAGSCVPHPGSRWAHDPRALNLAYHDRPRGPRRAAPCARSNLPDAALPSSRPYSTALLHGERISPGIVRCQRCRKARGSLIRAPPPFQAADVAVTAETRTKSGEIELYGETPMASCIASLMKNMCAPVFPVSRVSRSGSLGLVLLSSPNPIARVATAQYTLSAGGGVPLAAWGKILFRFSSQRQPTKLEPS
jgi:hypothetical protein